jgi:hypothetical protein
MDLKTTRIIHIRWLKKTTNKIVKMQVLECARLACFSGFESNSINPHLPPKNKWINLSQAKGVCFWWINWMWLSIPALAAKLRPQCSQTWGRCFSWTWTMDTTSIDCPMQSNTLPLTNLFHSIQFKSKCMYSN